jgi:hypothetical protein
MGRSYGHVCAKGAHPPSTLRKGAQFCLPCGPVPDKLAEMSVVDKHCVAGSHILPRTQTPSLRNLLRAKLG